MEHSLEFPEDPVRGENPHLVSESCDPAEETGRDSDPRCEKEAIVPIGNEHAVLPKPIDDNAGKLISKPQLYCGLFSVEHVKHFLRLVGKIELFRLRCLDPGDASLRDLFHFIHTAVSQSVAL